MSDVAHKRACVVDLQDELLKHEQVEINITHYFADGMYAREMVVPKGVVFTGKVHKTQHIIIVSQGDMTIADENGSVRVQAPYTMVCNPGTKRAGYAHEDTVWTNFHINPTNEEDVEIIESALVCDTYEEAQKFITSNDPGKHVDKLIDSGDSEWHS